MSGERDPDELHDRMAAGDGPHPFYAADYHSHMRRVAFPRERARTLMQEADAYGRDSVARVFERALDGDEEAQIMARNMIAGRDEMDEDDPF